MLSLQKNLNALAIFVIVGVLLSAYGVQLFWQETPCPLCLLQRIGMIGVASSLLLNLYCGIRTSHYALALFSSIVGGFVALRQISLHVCPGMPAYGLPVLGVSLYTWSFLVFVCCVLAVAILLLMYDSQQPVEEEPVNKFGYAAGVALLGITLANVLTTFIQCGMGPCE